MVKRTNKLYKLTQLFQEDKTVKAGVLANRTYPDGLNVAQVAFWNEYGTSSAPPRPFFRNAINENKSKWRATLENALKSTNYNTEKALAMLGEVITGDIKMSIQGGDFTSNSEVTNLLKSRFPMNPEDITGWDYYQAISDVQRGERGGEGKPLIWTGALFRSIAYEVMNES